MTLLNDPGLRREAAEMAALIAATETGERVIRSYALALSIAGTDADPDAALATWSTLAAQGSDHRLDDYHRTLPDRERKRIDANARRIALERFERAAYMALGARRRLFGNAAYIDHGTLALLAPAVVIDLADRYSPTPSRRRKFKGGRRA